MNDADRSFASVSNRSSPFSSHMTISLPVFLSPSPISSTSLSPCSSTHSEHLSEQALLRFISDIYDIRSEILRKTPFVEAVTSIEDFVTACIRRRYGTGSRSRRFYRAFSRAASLFRSANADVEFFARFLLDQTWDETDFDAFCYARMQLLATVPDAQISVQAGTTLSSFLVHSRYFSRFSRSVFAARDMDDIFSTFLRKLNLFCENAVAELLSRSDSSPPPFLRKFVGNKAPHSVFSTLEKEKVSMQIQIPALTLLELILLECRSRRLHHGSESGPADSSLNLSDSGEKRHPIFSLTPVFDSESIQSFPNIDCSSNLELESVSFSPPPAISPSDHESKILSNEWENTAHEIAHVLIEDFIEKSALVDASWTLASIHTNTTSQTSNSSSVENDTQSVARNRLHLIRLARARKRAQDPTSSELDDGITGDDSTMSSVLSSPISSVNSPEPLSRPRSPEEIKIADPLSSSPSELDSPSLEHLGSPPPLSNSSEATFSTSVEKIHSTDSQLLPTDTRSLVAEDRTDSKTDSSWVELEQEVSEWRQVGPLLLEHVENFGLERKDLVERLEKALSERDHLRSLLEENKRVVDSFQENAILAFESFFENMLIRLDALESRLSVADAGCLLSLLKPSIVSSES